MAGTKTFDHHRFKCYQLGGRSKVGHMPLLLQF